MDNFIKMDDFGGKKPYFWNTHLLLFPFESNDLQISISHRNLLWRWWLSRVGGFQFWNMEGWSHDSTETKEPLFSGNHHFGWFHVKLWKCIFQIPACICHMYMFLFLSLHIWISAGQASIIIDLWCKWLVWMAEAYVQLLRIQYNYRTLSGYLDKVDFAEPGFRQKPSEIRESQWDRRVEGQRKKERKKERKKDTMVQVSAIHINPRHLSHLIVYAAII